VEYVVSGFAGLHEVCPEGGTYEDVRAHRVRHLRNPHHPVSAVAKPAVGDNAPALLRRSIGRLHN
jgi:hypothetical protein